MKPKSNCFSCYRELGGETDHFLHTPEFVSTTLEAVIAER